MIEPWEEESRHYNRQSEISSEIRRERVQELTAQIRECEEFRDIVKATVRDVRLTPMYDDDDVNLAIDGLIGEIDWFIDKLKEEKEENED